MGGIFPNIAFIQDAFSPGFRLIDPEQLNTVFSYLMPTLRFITKPGDVDIIDTDRTLLLNKTVGQATNIFLEPLPVLNTRLQIKDDKGDAAVNNITVEGNGNLIDGGATALININYGWLSLVFNGTQWNVLSSGVTSGGGGGAVYPRTIGSGNSDAATPADSFIAWNSAAASNKTQTIPDGNTSAMMTIVDEIGTAGTYPVTITSATWTINGQSSFQLAATNAAITLRASPATSNWIIVA